MKVSREQAAQNRARIVRMAGERFREKGYDGIGINELMQAAGLTRGGFYGHFASRDDLVAEASAQALQSNAGFWAECAASGRPDALERLVRWYLSDRHRDAPAQGCALAALGAEAARQQPATRAAFTEGVEGMLEALGGLLEQDTASGGRERAMAALATLVGAVVLARAVDDEALSRAIRKAAEHAVLGEARGQSR